MKRPDAITSLTVGGNAHDTPLSIRLTAILSLAAGLAFIRPHLGTVLASILIAYIFNPVYRFSLQRTHRSGLAVVATLLTVILAFVVPIVLIAGVTVSQASSLAASIQDQSDPSVTAENSDDLLARSTTRVNALIDSLPGGDSLTIDEQDLIAFVRNAGATLAQSIANIIKRTGQTIADLITISILAFFLIAALLRHQDRIIGFMGNISPFDAALTNDYLQKAGLMTKAMVKGQLLIAVCQGLASAFSLWVAGLDYFWFLFVILSFLSFIPLGAGIVTIPIAIVMLLAGHPWQAVFVILFHLLVVTNIDNFLRPYLVPKAARLNPAVLLLAVFCGLALFGTIGVIYGPILMILLVTSLQVYAGYNGRAARPHKSWGQ